ncbi:MAG TPA: RNHCP domain-containing protein [Spirochaetia bacterium]|nr:RNHCP domain-containing protein [Spirochaetia bacterium]
MSRLRAPTPNNESFICAHCGATVSPPEAGSEQRNHCPRCLWSLHVDLRTGDRHSACKGQMEPVGVWTKEKGEWALIHRCITCGFLRANRIACDDDELRLFALAARPLTRLPFPFRIIDTYEVTGKQ